jgi:hypothetical protein
MLTEPIKKKKFLEHYMRDKVKKNITIINEVIMLLFSSFSLQRPRFNPRVMYVGIVSEKALLGQVLLRAIQFQRPMRFPPVFLIHAPVTQWNDNGPIRGSSCAVTECHPTTTKKIPNQKSIILQNQRLDKGTFRM